MSPDEQIYHLKQEVQRLELRCRVFEAMLKGKIDDALYRPVNAAIESIINGTR